MQEPTLKIRNAIAKAFFATFHGREVSEWGKEGGQDFSNQKEKDMFKKVARDAGRTSILLEEGTQSVLGNLFS